MQTYFGLDELNTKLTNTIITIGNFDGFHLGHQKIMQKVIELTKSHGGQSVVVTFDPHPSEVIRPQTKVKKLFLISDLEHQLQHQGIEHFFVFQFDRKLAETTPDYFIRLLADRLSPRVIVIGYDFSFGKNRAGNFESLSALGKSLGFSVVRMEAVLLQGEVVSSTRIRQLIEEGEVETAAQFLGRPYYLHGTIVRGESRGQQIGFPTANLNCQSELIPRSGVYVSEFEVGGQKWPAVTNIGHKPTFHDQFSLSIETHVLNRSENYYDQSVRVHLHKRLRSEIRFAGKSELVTQIRADVALANKYFGA